MRSADAGFPLHGACSAISIRSISTSRQRFSNFPARMGLNSIRFYAAGNGIIRSIVSGSKVARANTYSN
jgi:hypothetical protein